MSLHIDIAAAQYSLVIPLSEHDKLGDSNFTKYAITKVSPSTCEGMFAVTTEGDVYVNDTAKLIGYDSLRSISLSIIKYMEDGVTEEFSLMFRPPTDNLIEKRHEKCDLGCSIHDTEKYCKDACGFGAITGLCTWRQGEGNISKNYSTCTPNLETCPDGICSELEQKDFLICPQDCSTDKITGQFESWADGRGIRRAIGPCYCEQKPTAGEQYCNCYPRTAPMSNYNSSDPAGQVATGNRGDPSISKDSKQETCSSSCRAAIAGSLTAVVVVAMLAVLGWMAWRRRRRRQAVSLKHVNSLVSMSAVPSDYIVDDSRDPRTHVNRQTSSPSVGQRPTKIGLGQDVFEDKWEFPRRYLTLEHVIGEGEFGQVVRAQAFMLKGQEGNTTVAVKMLKPDASGAEYQDLVSEFQLLKEVDHPNVIRLLGVCTQKGPLYVIVEYCELGSLRNFLRASKFKNKGSWDDKQKAGSDWLMTTESAEPRILTCRDLFSFAWQIAKGMDYLAGLKIVHRDLAARNVLVTNGLKMKISDFGLSRDVYEADTYLKVSKGRIPVKWMAPESLYAQIYTTKSDIWSYGIVLWEVVTLGASPYPGIPPERLFPLLSTGYRMDRPEDCPEELYAIMQKCWKTEPENRPPFSVLRDILDHLLQQNTEYLDLSDDNYMLQGINSDSDEKRAELYPSPRHRTTKPQYSNVCSLDHCPPNVYVTTQWQGDDMDNEECPEMSKLLGDQPEAEVETTKPLGHARQADIILSKHLTDGKKKPGRVLQHENLTYV